MSHFVKITVLVSAMFVGVALAQEPQISPNAPEDKPTTIAPEELSKFERAIAPSVAEAKRTYPAAKKRFLAGLPEGQSFFITTRIRDGSGKFEQVFIAVATIKGGKVTGRIWSDVLAVKGFAHGDVYTFPEAEMMDWLITSPDGSEEGNFVGKFLDTYGGGP